MVVRILETKFDLGSAPRESMLSIEPTKDMHFIEEMEARLDLINMPYALVECVKLSTSCVKSPKFRKAPKETFIGWALITQLPLWKG